MKFFALVFLFLSPMAHADCLGQLSARLYKSVTAEGHKYHQVEAISRSQIQSRMRASDELSGKQIGDIMSLLNVPSNETYLLTASDGPAGYQDLFIVKSISCKTVRRFTIYVE